MGRRQIHELPVHWSSLGLAASCSPTQSTIYLDFYACNQKAKMIVVSSVSSKQFTHSIIKMYFRTGSGLSIRHLMLQSPTVAFGDTYWYGPQVGDLTTSADTDNKKGRQELNPRYSALGHQSSELLHCPASLDYIRSSPCTGLCTDTLHLPLWVETKVKG